MFIAEPSFKTSVMNGLRFFLEFVKNPSKIGAAFPSSVALAKEIVSEIPKDPNGAPRRILEIGPGTGSFTDKIIKRMNPQDELHLVEFDLSFSEELQKKYAHIPNIKVIHADILEHHVASDMKYDFVVSGLPLNSFRASFVAHVFEKITEFSKPNARVSYFEYLWLPQIKKSVSSDAEKRNLDDILKLKDQFYQKHMLRKRAVYLNRPPAQVVHHELKSAQP